MSLFKPAELSVAYLKMGIFGDPGSGKTTTASMIAIGFAKYLEAKKQPKPPVLMIDTETGSSWVKDLYDAADVQFAVAHERSFEKLKIAINEAEAAGAILIIDSITHFWEEIKAAAQAAKQKRIKRADARLEMPDFNDIKARWGAFTSLYLRSKAHVIICGRSGSIFDFQENEETKKKELITIGTRMAAEKHLGYECHLLVELLAEQSSKKGRNGFTHKAFVMKDRSRTIMGQTIANPGFKTFLPHIEKINIGGVHEAFQEGPGSIGLFPTDDRDDRSLQRKIVLDEIESLLVRYFPSTGAADKKQKLDLLKDHFKASWTEMEKVMPLEDLRAGYDTLHRGLEGEPSRYTAKAVELVPQTPVEEDGIPDFDTPAEKPRIRVKANGEAAHA